MIVLIQEFQGKGSHSNRRYKAELVQVNASNKVHFVIRMETRLDGQPAKSEIMRQLFGGQTNAEAVFRKMVKEWAYNWNKVGQCKSAYKFSQKFLG